MDFLDENTTEEVYLDTIHETLLQINDGNIVNCKTAQRLALLYNAISHCIDSNRDVYYCSDIRAPDALDEFEFLFEHFGFGIVYGNHSVLSIKYGEYYIFFITDSDMVGPNAKLIYDYQYNARITHSSNWGGKNNHMIIDVTIADNVAARCYQDSADLFEQITQNNLTRIMENAILPDYSTKFIIGDLND